MFNRIAPISRRFMSSGKYGSNITKNLNDRRKASEEKYFRQQEKDLLKKLQESFKKTKDKVSDIFSSPSPKK